MWGGVLMKRYTCIIFLNVSINVLHCLQFCIYGFNKDRNAAIQKIINIDVKSIWYMNCNAYIFKIQRRNIGMKVLFSSTILVLVEVLFKLVKKQKEQEVQFEWRAFKLMSRMSSRFEQGAAAVSTLNMLFMLFLPHDVKRK